MKKYIKLNEYQASHIYELAYENFQTGCYGCNRLQQRLEKFIGDKEVKAIKRTIKKCPYKDD